MKLFYDKNEPMNCMEALWYAAGDYEEGLIPVRFINGVMYIECDDDLILVYDKNTEDKTLVASLNANCSMKFLSDVLEHIIFKLQE